MANRDEPRPEPPPEAAEPGPRRRGRKLPFGAVPDPGEPALPDPLEEPGEVA